MLSEKILKFRVTPEEYDDMLKISSSGIRILLNNGPQAFKKYYVDKIKDSSEAEYFTIGKLVELLITGKKDTVDSQYVIVDYSSYIDLPEGLMNDFYISLLELCAKNNSVDVEDFYEMAYNNTAFKWKLDRVITNFLPLLPRLKFELGIKLSGKIPLKTSTYKIAEQCATALLTDRLLEPVFNNIQSDWDVYDDICLVFKDYKCRIDRLFINNTTNKIHIIDFKTTSKPIINFDFKKFGYDLQLAFYSAIIQNILNVDIENGSVSNTITDDAVSTSLVVVDTNYFDTTYINIETSTETLTEMVLGIGYLKVCIEKDDYSYKTIKTVHDTPIFKL